MRGDSSEIIYGNLSEINSEVMTEDISGIPSEIIFGIQGPQLLLRIQGLYQVAWRQDYIGSDTVLSRQTRQICVYNGSHKLLKKPSTELKLPGALGGSTSGA